MSSRRRSAGSLPMCALFTALLCAASQIQIPLPGVPLSLSLLAVHLCAMLLGPKQAVLSILAYLLLGLCGVPVFAGFASGPAALLGPTGGFLLSYPLCALCTALLIRRFGHSFRLLFFFALVSASLCMVLGVSWFMLITAAPVSLASIAYWLLYIPGDVLKAALASALAVRLFAPIKSISA